MSFAVIMLWGIIKATEKVVGSDPAVKTFRLSWYDLNMEVAIWQLKLGGPARKGAHLIQYGFPLIRRQYAHARGGKKKKGRVRNLVERYVFERMAEQLVQVVGADAVGTVAKG